MIRRRWRRWALRLGLVEPARLIAPPLAIEVAARVAAEPEDGAIPPAALEVLAADGSPLALAASAWGDWRLPTASGAAGRWLPLAVVAIEDHRFAAHAGIDWLAVSGAMAGHLLPGGRGRGASTLTMQVARLRAADRGTPNPRTLASKWREAVRARQLERRLGKAEILHEWMERAPFGANRSGIGAASRHWFGCPPERLSLAQAALLAGLPQAPERLRPDRSATAAIARRAVVLGRMLALGMITADQHRVAGEEPLRRQREPTAGDWRWPGGEERRSRGRTGIIATTIDPRWQAALGAALRRAMAPLGDERLLAAGVAVARADGRVLAAVSLGGGSIDLTAQPRSPGSALKPLIYAAAFADGWCAPSTLLDDAPMAWTGWRPANLDAGHRGAMRADEALAESRNLPAIDLLARVGPRRIAAVLAAAGVQVDTADAGLAMAIGAVPVTVRQLAGVYAGLAAQAEGEGREAYGAAQALAALAAPERTRPIDAGAADAGIAWKTGTSSGHRDAWCAAVAGGTVVVGWIGVDAGPGREQLLGAEVAARPILACLAGLDPTPARSGALPAEAGRRRLPAVVRRLRIVTPEDGSELLIPAGGAVPLRAAAAQGACWWFSGSEPIGRSGGDGVCWWRPRPGQHELRAVDDGGYAAVVRVGVVAALGSPPAVPP